MVRGKLPKHLHKMGSPRIQAADLLDVSDTLLALVLQVDVLCHEAGIAKRKIWI